MQFLNPTATPESNTEMQEDTVHRIIRKNPNRIILLISFVIIRTILFLFGSSV